MLKDKPVFNYLPDKASHTDLLGGGHQRIAGTIWDFIQDKKNEGGITIGIEGKWGSGKSTIIEFLKEKCREETFDDETQKCLVFTFDAWAHENDPLRRTFLTSLLDYLGKKKWLVQRKQKDSKILTKSTR